MTKLSRDERVLRWVHVEPAELDVAPVEPGDAELVERAAKHLACRRFDCQNDALAPFSVATSVGPRWVDLCAECALVLAKEVGPPCVRCDRAAPAERSRGGWCPACCGRLHSTILRATEHRTALLAELTPSSSAAHDVKIKGTKEPPAPISIGVESLAEDIRRAYCDTEDQLRAHRHDEPAARFWRDSWQRVHPVNVNAQFGAAIVYVKAHWLELLDTITGRETATGLLRIATQVMHALGRDRLVHELDAPCPWCGMQALVRKDGADLVECQACQHTAPESTYEWLVGAALEAHAAGQLGAAAAG